jgi:anaerobic selenocysteine-containing dehydrogenase
VEPILDRCTPAWTEAATDVPAAAVEEAARLYGSGPALLWLGQGMQRNAHGGNAFRACAMLPAATGNFGRPGSGIYYLNMDSRIRGLDDDCLVAAHLRRGERVGFSHMELAPRLESEIQAFVCWNINPAASNPEQVRLRRALGREDLFTVVCELFETDTTDFADIVLPAASFLEFDDLVASYFHLTIGPQTKVQEPIGDSLPNQEIFRRLARAMEYAEPELYESDEAILAHLLRGVSCVSGFEELKRKGTVFVADDPVLQFADLRFPTPSGRIEIASARAEADGHPRLPRPVGATRPAAGRVRLLSPASEWQMNFSFANEPRVDERLGAARVAFHPRDAATFGVKDGELARLSNETGEIVLRVRISEEIRPGVALTHKGRWPRREPGRANVNVLTPGTKTDLGESTCVHGVEVSVTPG